MCIYISNGLQRDLRSWISICMIAYIYICVYVYICIYIYICKTLVFNARYGVATISRMDKVKCLFCKRAL